MNLKNMLGRLYRIFKPVVETINVRKHDSPIKRLDNTPDRPISFGYKTAWLAIEDATIERVVEILDIKVLGKANWESGLSVAYSNNIGVFITPPVNGWIFVIGLSVNDWKEFVLTTAKSISNFCYFFTERVSETHAWILVKDNAVVRAFGYSGGSNEILFDEGNLTKEEISLNLSFTKLKNGEWCEDTRIPDEDDVLAISAAWTIDTLELENLDAPKSVGVVGLFNK